MWDSGRGLRWRWAWRVADGAPQATRKQAEAEAETPDPCEGRTIWNSDGANGWALICPPPVGTQNLETQTGREATT